MTLFEFYLYEAYPLVDQVEQLEQSCLPFWAILKFYNDFAMGFSSRMNKSSLAETVKCVMGLDPNAVIDEGLKKPNPQGITVKVTFHEFNEIVFEISQEINMNRNISPSQKYREYIEKVLLQ